MRFLFLYSNLHIGGVQTLLLRMSKWLDAHGHTVHLWVAEGGEVESEIKKYAYVEILGVRKYQLLQSSLVSRLAKRKCFDVVHAFDPIGMWIGVNISKICRSRLIVGVYHPQYYQFGTIQGAFYPQEYEELLSLLPDEAFLFMNEATLKAHAIHYRRRFARSSILPLPVDDPGARDPVQGLLPPLRIVSVGRFVDFKRYPLGVMLALDRLIKKGYKDIVYEIYGYGPLETEFKAFASQRDGKRRIRFLGPLPYKNLSTQLRGAWVFVGMGTSVIESAIIGIPSIVMPVYSEGHECYGYLHEQMRYNLGEEGKSKPLIEVLNGLIELSPSQYIELSHKERQFALRFSLDKVMSQYLDVVYQAPVLPKSSISGRFASMMWKKILYKVRKFPSF